MQIPQNSTLNQLDAMFQEIAQNIATINAYGTGEIYEFNTSTVKNYPIFWTRMDSFGIYETYTTFNYTLFILDLVHPDNSNLLDVQSDAVQTLHHILYTLRDTYDLYTEWGQTSQLLIYANPDMVSGFSIPVKIEVPWSFGSCDVPLRHAQDYNYFSDYNGTYLFDFNNKPLLTF
jgi:hypothetical protein